MAGRQEAERGKEAVDRRWHAVAVKPGAGACPAVVSGRNQRWLSREAPRLPLPSCTRPEGCNCTYEHHADRRAGARRVEEMDAFRRPVTVLTERRARKDRRAPQSH